MNKEQAIDLLDNLIGMVEDNQDNDYDTAFHMAIEALKQPELICCGECGHSMYDEDGMMYCYNPNTDIYYTHYNFACNRAERRPDG